jgi:hypothetical protein
MTGEPEARCACLISAPSKLSAVAVVRNRRFSLSALIVDRLNLFRELVDYAAANSRQSARRFLCFLASGLWGGFWCRAFRQNSPSLFGSLIGMFTCPGSSILIGESSAPLVVLQLLGSGAFVLYV